MFSASRRATNAWSPELDELAARARRDRLVALAVGPGELGEDAGLAGGGRRSARASRSHDARARSSASTAPARPPARRLVVAMTGEERDGALRRRTRHRDLPRTSSRSGVYGQPRAPRFSQPITPPRAGVRFATSGCPPRATRTLSASARETPPRASTPDRVATTGRPRVAAFANRGVERDLAEERRLQTLRFAAAAAVPEDLRAVCRSAGSGRSSCSRRCRGSARRPCGTSRLP